jgi:hypothetical protein
MYRKNRKEITDTTLIFVPTFLLRVVTSKTSPTTETTSGPTTDAPTDEPTDATTNPSTDSPTTKESGGIKVHDYLCLINFVT